MDNSNKKFSSFHVPLSEDWVNQIKSRAEANVRRHESCTQSIVEAFMHALNIDDPLVMRASGALFGGMVSSLTCGVHTGAAMVLGLFLGREKMDQGQDALFPIVGPTQHLIGQLNEKLGSPSCLELTGVDFTDLNQAMRFRLSQGHEKCIQRVAQGAEILARFLQELEKSGDLERFWENQAA